MYAASLKSLLTLVVFALPLACIGHETPFLVEDNKIHKFSAECGVYSLAIAASALGKDVELTSLLKSEYVPTLDGSSAQDLIAAANSLGLYAVALKGMTIQSLRGSRFPLLLNLRSDRSSECTGHWVTFLGEHDSNAMIFDPSKSDSQRAVPFSQIAVQWSGTAVGVFDAEITWLDMLWLRICSTSTMVFYLAIIFAGFLTVQRLKPGISPLVVLATLTILIAIFQSQGADSLFRNQSVASFLESKYSTTDDFKRIKPSALMSEIRANSAVIIDARFAEAFEFGHIPTAINLPIDSDISELTSFANRHDRNENIVVYCLSENCTYALTMARRLRARGLKSIRIFEEGLVGFNDYVSKPNK